MTYLFAGLAIFGFVEVVGLVIASAILSRSDRPSDRDGVSFRLMGQAVGLLATGAGGLAMTLGGSGALGFTVVTICTWLILMALLYTLVLPHLRERQD